jgi:hypothetical protein
MLPVSASAGGRAKVLFDIVTLCSAFFNLFADERTMPKRD